jgi:hypothetical protein
MKIKNFIGLFIFFIMDKTIKFSSPLPPKAIEKNQNINQNIDKEKNKIKNDKLLKKINYFLKKLNDEINHTNYNHKKKEVYIKNRIKHLVNQSVILQKKLENLELKIKKFIMDNQQMNSNNGLLKIKNQLKVLVLENKIEKLKINIHFKLEKKKQLEYNYGILIKTFQNNQEFLNNQKKQWEDLKNQTEKL